MHSNIKHMNYKHWKMGLSQQWTFKPQNFDRIDANVLNTGFVQIGDTYVKLFMS